MVLDRKVLSMSSAATEVALTLSSLYSISSILFKSVDGGVQSLAVVNSHSE